MTHLIPATLLRVVDGDTIRVRAKIWPGQYVETFVRLRGVDTPELRSKDPRERRRAEEAKAFVAEWLKDQRLSLMDPKWGSFARRVVATVLVDGRDLADRLKEEGLEKEG